MSMYLDYVSIFSTKQDNSELRLGRRPSELNPF